MSDHYTDEELFAVRVVLACPSADASDTAVRILDAVAPAIDRRSAARALRNLADDVGGVRTAADGGPSLSLIGAETLRARADEIEAGS